MDQHLLPEDWRLEYTRRLGASLRDRVVERLAKGLGVPVKGNEELLADIAWDVLRSAPPRYF